MMCTAAVVVVVTVSCLAMYTQDCISYHVERSLQGPIPQDDPHLIQWVRSQLVPPSRHPYNLSLLMSGLHQEADKAEKNGGSYSPSQEFILGKVEELYGKKLTQPGTFLEAGAYDGEFLSNTLYLEHDFNWRGLLVEANPVFFEQLLWKRRKSYAINVCLNTKPFPSKETFLTGSAQPKDTNHLVNQNSADQPSRDPLMEQHISLGSSGLMEYKHNDTQVGSVTEVQCVPLYTVIRALGRTHIDFLSLDVEHAEMGILDTVPWGEISFTVMAIEHTTQDDLVSYLDQRGYQHVGSFLEDHIFVNKKNI
ncbi:hypothetical protein O3P69_011159 [Scylla paramamosain]|uniref:Methyltransferase FkbM domain-containing protein n=2 Tax=Scylla paramamosain TaxID=85552 RepID=A0AAW0STH0_SCYPA